MTNKYRMEDGYVVLEETKGFLKEKGKEFGSWLDEETTHFMSSLFGRRKE